MFKSSWKVALGLCMLGCALYAGDEPVLIDQDRATQGSVTSGDDPGFPVTISKPGSYRLMGNLTVSDMDTTAIRITANSVTIDLNGFSILGPVVCSEEPLACPAPGTGAGILASESQSTRGVKVMNGSVSGMGGPGIQLNGERSSVQDVMAENNAGGGIYVTGSVVASSASRNGSFGIFALTVRDSYATQNAHDGILLIGGGMASGNVSSLNGGTGIFAQLAVVTNNRVFLNQGVGITALCPSVITRNIILASAVAIQAPDPGCAITDNASRP